MKPLLMICLIVALGVIYAQEDEIYDGEWKLETLTINGEVLVPPSNEEISEVFLYFENNAPKEPPGMRIVMCRSVVTFTEFLSNNDFTSLYVGGIEPDSNMCKLPENITFDEIYFNFYQSDDDGYYEYELETGAAYNTLLIKSSEEDKALYVSGTLATPSVAKKHSFVYPNPVYDKLHIYDNKALTRATIYGVLGEIKGLYKSPRSIDVSRLTKGLYFLKVEDITGNSKTLKFVKH